MKRLYLFFSLIVVLFIIFFNCQTPGESKGGGDGYTQIKIIASDGDDNDFFGDSVSISGDYVIAGADNEDGINRGAAYIFHRMEADIWDTGTKVTAFDARDGDRFGSSVSISGDYAIVGASHKNCGGDQRGAIYIFYRTGINTWNGGTQLFAPDEEDEDWFGCSVSISGDYAIVGAHGEDGSGINQGAAYIFRRNGLVTWDDGTKISASDAGNDDYFGQSVSISGDYAIVGAPCADDGIGTDRGAIYFFHRTGRNTWDDRAKMVAPDIGNDNQFGYSVSISGDYAIVGAFKQDVSETEQGAAYFYRRTGTNTWVFIQRVTAFDAADYDWFGRSVSISGNYAIAGSYIADEGGIDRGAAYIFHRTGTNTWDTGTKVTAFDGKDYDTFGKAVSISENYIFVGAPNCDRNPGAAYIIK